MLRLKEKQLEDALRKLWPHLLSELVGVFDVQKEEQKLVKGQEEDIRRHK